MKMLRRIKLRALLFRRHYSNRYHRLGEDHDHGQYDDRKEEDHHAANFFRNLSRKFNRPLACMRVTAQKTLSITHSSSRKAVPRDVHRGSCAVYVGPEQKRFVMKTCYLEHPVFGELLEKSREEFGFDYAGGLLIPCPVSVFESLLCLMKQKKKNSGILMESGELTRLIQRCSITTT